MPLPDEHGRLELPTAESAAALQKHLGPGKLDPSVDRVDLVAFGRSSLLDVGSGIRRVLDEAESFEPVQGVAHPSHQAVFKILVCKKKYFAALVK